MQSVIENTDLPTPLQQRCAWQTIIIELTDMKDHVMSSRGCVQVPLDLHFQSGGAFETSTSLLCFKSACTSIPRNYWLLVWRGRILKDSESHWQCCLYSSADRKPRSLLMILLHTLKYFLFNLLLTPHMMIAFAKCWRSRTPCSFYRHCSIVLMLLHAHRGGCWFVTCIVNLSILQWIVVLSPWNEKIIKLMSMFISKKE